MYTTTISGSGANSSPFHDAAVLPSDHRCQLRRSVFEIACGVGLPIKLTLEFGTINRSFGLFAKVLVDFDLVIISPSQMWIEWNSDVLTTVPIKSHLGWRRNHNQMTNFVSKRKEVLCAYEPMVLRSVSVSKWEFRVANSVALNVKFNRGENAPFDEIKEI
ncbi:hypothetical protein ACFX13_045125 [Malus domestica]